MKVLFVSSGNSRMGISPIVKAQGESLRKAGIDVFYYTIKGKGIKGYLSNVIPLRKHLKENQYDIIHSHYGLTSIISYLASPGKRIISSFMGEDILGSYRHDGSLTLKSRLQLILFRYFAKRHFVNIVKSDEMKRYLKAIDVLTIPNGVNIDFFKPLNTDQKRNELNLARDKKVVLFVSDPARIEKNYSLAMKSVRLINDMHIELVPVYGKDHNELVDYYNCADVFILTSFHEGSPNVIKEAMACNCPIVATDVGDVKWVLGETRGCYIAGFDANDFSEKIKKALEFSEMHGRTNGRDRIIELGLDADSVAKRITEVYKEVIKQH